MPYGISIQARGIDVFPILRLWDEAAAFEAAPSMAELDYDPHVTLAIYDEIDVERLRDAAAAVFAKQPPIALTFDRIEHFEGEQWVLWAAPRPSAALVELQAAVHREIDPGLCWPHYRPDAWRPHCTVAMDVPPEKRAAALAWAGQPRVPFTVTFDVGDCARFYPVELLAEWTLTS
ncbi:MAG: 2'-5' RNA ligase family protein [Alphaproteobacteria bacterium]